MEQVRESLIFREMPLWKLGLFLRLEGLIGPLSASPCQILTVNDLGRKRKGGASESWAHGRAFSCFSLRTQWKELIGCGLEVVQLLVVLQTSDRDLFTIREPLGRIPGLYRHTQPLFCDWHRMDRGGKQVNCNWQGCRPLLRSMSGWVRKQPGFSVP